MMTDQTFSSEGVEIISERVRLSGKAPVGQPNQLATLEGGFVSEDSDQGNVGGLDGIGVTLALPSEKLYELMDQMGMRTAVTSALGETQVFLAILVGIYSACREGSDFLGK